MATAAVRDLTATCPAAGIDTDIFVQNPPLYLHVTSTTKEGLEQAVQKIEELMKQELPQLVDERRFRRREQEQVERDEFGRVCTTAKTGPPHSSLTNSSANGPRRRFPSTWSPFLVSTFARRS